MRERLVAPFGLLVLALALGAPLTGQDSVAGMASECAPAADPTLRPLCTDAALALGGLRAGIGLAAAQGSPVPGSASTLGRRMASSPRVALSLRGGLARARFADPGTGSGSPDERGSWARTLEGQVTVGLVEGWSLLPTVGGFLSLDLIGTLGLVGLSESAGFEGSVQEAGYGARIGVFRESFTLPGVSVSLARRHLGEVEWGEDGSDGARLAFKPTVTSLRATVAKDLLALGVLGGWGWERYGGSSSLTARRTVLGVARTGEASSDDFHTDRHLLFAGLSYTFLVLQLSAEAGWANGFSGPDGSGGWDPGSGSLFGSIAGRLTY